jgi:hypothetical protein
MQNREQHARTITLMSSSVRRSIKMLTGIGRNSGRRDWTSIGLRGMRVTVGKTATRTKVGLPSMDLSYAHREESRSIGVRAPARNPPLNSSAPPDKDWRGLLWIALTVCLIAAAAAQVIK